MKATGIVRRVDDLGRVVIPKEIRRSMKINAGDPLELFTENGYVCFKKYSPIGEFDVDQAKKLVYGVLYGQFVITDRDEEIFTADSVNTQLQFGADKTAFEKTAISVDGEYFGDLWVPKGLYSNALVVGAVRMLQALFNN